MSDISKLPDIDTRALGAFRCIEETLVLQQNYRR